MILFTCLALKYTHAQALSDIKVLDLKKNFVNVD